MGSQNHLSFVAREGLHNVTVHLFRRRLPDGPLWYRFWLGGKKYSASTGMPVDRDARQIARDALIEAIARSTAREAVDRRLEACVRVYQENIPPTYSKAHRRNTRYRLGGFVEYADPALDLAASSADRMSALVQNFLAERAAAGNGPVTIRNYRVALSGFFAWLMRRRENDGTAWVQWAFNPASSDRVESPRIEIKLRPPLEDDQVEALIKAASGTDLLPAVVLMLSGCRPVGVARMRWRDVDTEKRIVWVQEKGHLAPVPISTWAADRIKGWMKTRSPKPTQDDVVCGTTREGMDQSLKYLRLAHGLPAALTWGALRRYADFKLYQAGVSPQEAGAQLRHSPATAQKHYVDWRKLTSHKVADVLSFERPAKSPAKSPVKSSRAKARK
ncbi:MAG: hypothetical protein AMXMBFR7_06960 [Planctomycetota bacterium]